MKQPRGPVVALLLAAALAVPSRAEKISVHVNQIASGDTIVVKLRRKPVRIHVWGIAAPVVGQPFFAQSKQSLSDLVLNKDVIADLKSMLPGGDLVAKVAWVKPASGKPTDMPKLMDIGLEAVEAGMAWWNPTGAPAAKELQSAQGQAKAAKKGLWAEPNPVAPWTFGKKPPVKPGTKPKK